MISKSIRPTDVPRLILFALVTASGCGHSLPRGQSGAAADALAHRIERAVHADAWARTGAVKFVFRGDNEYLWDKSRDLARIRFRRTHETVLLDVAKKSGKAYEDGRELTGEAKRKLLDKGYQAFCNDTFWLNPLVKLFDGGVTRSRVVDKDGESLIVHYASGGVTPGDSYQWLIGANGLPSAWRMYVHILRVKGLETTWEGWITLSTGAIVATRHKALGINAVTLSEVAGAAKLAELEPGPDPFAALTP